MPNRGLWATVAVVALAVLAVTTAALGAFELSQPTSTTATTSTNYSASLSSSLNVSLRSNTLYPSTNLTNPSAIFSNVTTSLGLSFWFRFAASQPLAVAGVLSFAGEFYSGTTPSWSKTVFSVSEPIFINSAAESVWFTPPISLPSISSTLNQSSAIDSELGLVPGAGTLEVNASFDIDLPESGVAQNNSSVELTFVYSSGLTGGASLSAYSAMNALYSSPGDALGGWAVTDTSPLPSYTVLGDAFLAVAVGAFVAAAFVGALYLPRQRPSTLQRFLFENSENVVRVTADTRVGGRAVGVKDLDELVKLANIAAQPIFLFESPRGALLYVIQGETTFAYAIVPDPAEGSAS